MRKSFQVSGILDYSLNVMSKDYMDNEFTDVSTEKATIDKVKDGDIILS